MMKALNIIPYFRAGSKERRVMALDLGGTKVTAIIAVQKADGMEIVGYGCSPCDGFNKDGYMAHLDAFGDAINSAVRTATAAASCKKIREVKVGITDRSIMCEDIRGMAKIGEQGVSQANIGDAIALARAAPSRFKDQEELHSLAKFYYIDAIKDVKNPLGRSGNRLELHAYRITCSANILKDINKCLQQLDLLASEIIFTPLASAAAVLSDEQRDRGVCLINIGGCNADMVVYHGGSIRHAEIMLAGSEYVTKGIVSRFHVTYDVAEKLIMQHGCAMIDAETENRMIRVPMPGDRREGRLSRHELGGEINLFFTQVFEYILEALKIKKCLELLDAGVILTGEGAHISGLNDLAENILGRPVATGYPTNVSDLGEKLNNPSFTSSVGLLLWNRDQQLQLDSAPPYGLLALYERSVNWFRNNS